MSQHSKSKIKLPAPHIKQIPILENTSRFKVLDCGRRFGKSTYLLIEAAIDLLQHGHRVAYLAPTFTMLLDFWNELKSTLALITEQKSEQEKMLRLKNGGYFKGFSANNPEVIRGGKYHKFLIDEAAIIPDLGNIWNNIIRPTLADYIGKAVFGSTPRGNNFFKTLFDRGMNEDERYKDYASFLHPSWDNPFLKRQEILDSVMDISELAGRQEIMAEFLDDVGSVFVGVAIAARGFLLEPYNSSHLSIGIDLGQKRDYTVISTYDGERGQIVDYERFNTIRWQDQIEKIIAYKEKWNDASITLEVNNVGSVILEMLQDRGLYINEFHTNNENKRNMIEGMAGDIQWGRMVLPADPVVVGEFQTFESKIMESGKIKYAAAKSFHDDCVMSFGLAREGYFNRLNTFGLALPVL
jgi:hypothetical protein